MKRRLFTGFACLIMTALLVAFTSAKSIDRSAQFGSEEYWSSHALYLARIGDCEYPANSNGLYVTTFVPTQMISGSVAATNRSVQSYPGRFGESGGNSGEQPVDFPLGTAVGSVILVSEWAEYHQITVVRVMQFPEDQALLWELMQIADLRKEPKVSALLAGATAPLDLESEYCLNRLLTMPGQIIPDAEVAKLQTVADDEGRPANLRMAAEQVALRYSELAQADQCATAYRWLREAIETTAAHMTGGGNLPGEGDTLRPLFMRLFEFAPRRTETVDYVLGLLGDQHASAESRVAASSALSSWDQEVFNFPHPDKLFARMFATYSGMLTDPNPDVRISGLAMLFDRTMTIMDMQSPPELAREYGDKAVQALKQAIAVESDPRVLRFFQSRLTIYEDRQAHPERWRRIHHLEMNSGRTQG